MSSPFDGFLTDKELKAAFREKGVKEPSDRALRSWRRKGLLAYTRVGRTAFNHGESFAARLASSVKKHRP